MADVILRTKITADRRLELELPPDVPLGWVDIVIRPATDQRLESTAAITAREVLNSAMFGYWRDRDDIGDSAAYIERLRHEEEARRDPWQRQ